MSALRAAGCVFAEDEAAILFEAVSEGMAASTDSDAHSGAGSDRLLAGLIARRVGGEPLEQIVGWVDFSSLRLSVRPGVFVPRQRTALLAAHTVAAAQQVTDSRRNGTEADAGVAAARPLVLEAFCGVGPVASVVAASVPGVDLHFGDAQVEAVRCAVENVERCIQSRNSAHVGESAQAGGPEQANESGTLVTGHALDCLHGLPDSLRQSISVIAAVPPYVPETAADFLPHEALDFEPSSALFGGSDGLDLVRRLITEALDWLAPYGVLLIELGQGQVAEATGFAAERGLEAQSHLGEDEQTVVLELRRRN
ncbi:release factor glutamine methyltransferase [Brevibacterium iodinum ATCC 49514]|uniref:Release factor glutamine methyltransferase n=1 Tax=Brevibacterium iodinum ATCC 49514 TaxID=1255616 RepID=A0A2H1IF77_9MICO|nr:SAM-dependent methyltransferase [Brevibacterium iodinum]SMX73879.1 release factor glutamine methyltransferase [Brevibacterium iodinum ATCC 49514]SUW13021.1 Release factor glutamine methyltransferase [Brevibacterium iodinum]